MVQLGSLLQTSVTAAAVAILFIGSNAFGFVTAFTVAKSNPRTLATRTYTINEQKSTLRRSFFTSSQRRNDALVLMASPSDNENDTNFAYSLSESNQAIVGSIGTVSSLIVLYSEYTLKTTGCGLPAGPGGIVGALEGISYLAIVALAGLSSTKKLSTGSGLPAGPYGILGAGEGLSFLAIFVGLIVLAFQVLDYGYIPNAVPMEGGMCS